VKNSLPGTELYVRMKHNGRSHSPWASYRFRRPRTAKSISYIASLQIYCKQRIAVEYAVTCFRLKRGFRLSY